MRRSVSAQAAFLGIQLSTPTRRPLDHPARPNLATELGQGSPELGSSQPGLQIVRQLSSHSCGYGQPRARPAEFGQLRQQLRVVGRRGRCDRYPFSGQRVRQGGVPVWVHSPVRVLPSGTRPGVPSSGSVTAPVIVTPAPKVQSPGTVSDRAFRSDGAPEPKRCSKSSNRP